MSDENKNLPVKLTGDTNKIIAQIGTFLPTRWFVQNVIKNQILQARTQKDIQAMNDNKAYADDTRKVIYFDENEDPNIKIARMIDSQKIERETQHQMDICNYIVDLLNDKQKSWEEHIIGLNTDDQQYINDDFMPFWERYSYDMTNDELKIMWAKILVQEIEQPRSTSKRTMDFIRTMKHKEAKMINILFPYVIAGTGVPNMYNVLHRVDFGYLENIGILIRNTTFSTNPQNQYIFLHKYVLSSKKKCICSTSLLTDIGQELYQLADIEDTNIELLEEVFNADNNLSKDSQIIFHHRIDETRYETVPFHTYTKVNTIPLDKKHEDLPRISLEK